MTINACTNKEEDMAKKFFRSALTLVFTAVVAVNLMLAYAPATSAAEASEASAKGTIFTSGGGVTACLCSGDECLACVAV